jgi:programmed cell death 6-interacting protein
MLAQGQLCFYEKALRDRKAGSMKPGIIAKIASQTSVYYDSVCRFCADVSLSRVLDPSWKAHAEFQARCIEGVAEYWMAVAVKEDAAIKAVGYGEEIARLTRAERIVSKSIALAQSARLAPEVYNSTESLLRTIVSAKTSAEKDNRLLYLEPIPPDSSLTAIEKIAMVKASSLPEYYCTEKFLFPSLFPIEIKAAVELYSKGALKIYDDYKVKTDESGAQARATLGSLGLPAKLEAFKAEGGLPDSLWTRIVQLQGIGRSGSSCPPKDMTLEMFDDLVRAAEVSAEKFTHCENSLAREEANDERFRTRQPAWKGQPTSMLNRDIKIHLARLKEAYQSAK